MHIEHRVRDPETGHRKLEGKVEGWNCQPGNPREARRAEMV